jgi:hypothetical protein
MVYSYVSCQESLVILKSFYRRQFLSAPSCLLMMFVRVLSNRRRHFSLGVFGLEEAPFTPS